MSVPKRILVVTRSTIAHQGSGGMEAVSDDVIRHLAAEGYELALLTTPGFDDERVNSVYKQTWTVSGARPGKYSLRWWVHSASRKSEWHAWCPDVIFSVSSAAASFTVGSAWNKSAIISQCHGTAWHEVLSSLSTLSVREVVKIPLNMTRIIRERLAYRRFSLIAAIGPGVAKQLTSAPLSLAASKVVTIPNAVDANFWKFSQHKRHSARVGLGLACDVPLAMFSGRLHRQKGVDLAITALSSLTADGWHLLICGEGPEFDNLGELCEQLGVSERVHFVGRVSRTSISNYLSAADLFVFPTRRHEGLPMNILEAVASGLPVLTSDSANLPSDLRPYVHYTALDSASLAYQWKQIDRSLSRDCRLPPVYNLPVMLEEYRLIISEA